MAAAQSISREKRKRRSGEKMAGADTETPVTSAFRVREQKTAGGVVGRGGRQPKEQL
jgi:hypothetical protein